MRLSGHTQPFPLSFKVLEHFRAANRCPLRLKTLQNEDPPNHARRHRQRDSPTELRQNSQLERKRSPKKRNFPPAVQSRDDRHTFAT
jgi:hypothetical protein